MLLAGKNIIHKSWASARGKNLQEIDIPNYLDAINFWISPWAPLMLPGISSSYFRCVLSFWLDGAFLRWYHCEGEEEVVYQVPFN